MPDGSVLQQAIDSGEVAFEGQYAVHEPIRVWRPGLDLSRVTLFRDPRYPVPECICWYPIEVMPSVSSYLPAVVL